MEACQGYVLTPKLEDTTKNRSNVGKLEWQCVDLHSGNLPQRFLPVPMVTDSQTRLLLSSSGRVFFVVLGRRCSLPRSGLEAGEELLAALELLGEEFLEFVPNLEDVGRGRFGHHDLQLIPSEVTLDKDLGRLHCGRILDISYVPIVIDRGY